MKSMKLFFIATVLGILAITVSCKKEAKDYNKCFPIPNTKAVSTTDFLYCQAEANWSTSSGLRDSFVSRVSSVNFLVNDYQTDSLLEVIIPWSGTVQDSIISPLLVALLFRINGDDFQVFAAKPAFYGNSPQVWNINSKAEIGVAENENTICITSNGLASPYYDGVFMCIEVIIHKKKF